GLVGSEMCIRDRHAEDEATVVALRALDTAAASDTATGGHNPRANVFPTVRVITREGIHEVSDTELAKLYRSEV
ncbi:MAG: hypothetical protein N3A53_06335, partial [Verrucomicrobiae bacterium]|nr:hypothetical protein [Verrucomicrobiae bacterium]